MGIIRLTLGEVIRALCGLLGKGGGVPLGDVVVDPRVSSRHPDVSEYSVQVAWRNVVRFMPREGTDPLRYVAVGYDEYGRLLEMVAVLDESDRWHVFHAMKATPKVLRELRIS